MAVRAVVPLTIPTVSSHNHVHPGTVSKGITNQMAFAAQDPGHYLCLIPMTALQTAVHCSEHKGPCRRLILPSPPLPAPTVDAETPTPRPPYLILMIYWEPRHSAAVTCCLLNVLKHK